MFRARLVARLVTEVRVPEGARAHGLAFWLPTRWLPPERSPEGGGVAVAAHLCLRTCRGGERWGLPLGSLKQQP